MELIQQKLEKLRSEFVDTALGVSVLSGLVSQLLTFLRDYPDYINTSTWARLGALLVFTLVFYYRKFLSGNLKIFLLVFLIFNLFTLSVINFGFYSPIKLFIVFGPVVLAFILPRTLVLISSAVFTLIFIYSSWALMNGSATYMILPSKLMTDIFHWGTELGFALSIIFSLIIMINRFRIQLGESIDDSKRKNEKLESNRKEISDFNLGLERVIDEKTSDLKRLVDDLALQNRELKNTNSEISKYNAEIEETSSRLKLVRERMVMSDKLASLGLLTAGVCHEIKNPLNHISGSTKILRDHLMTTTAPADQLKLLDAIQTGVGRIKAIVDSLNQLDHVSFNSKDSVDLIRVIENCRRVLDHLFTPGIKYTFSSNLSSVEINTNSEFLHQVILNVMQNAVESIRDTGTVEVAVLISKDKAIVEISDTGCGIPEEYQNQVTDPFFTTKSTDTHTGLGLYHVQKLMTDNGGKLIINSDVNEGTVVQLVFSQVVTKE